MNDKIIYQLFSSMPKDVIQHICDYDNTYKQRMNNVIHELNDYNNKVEEYEYYQYCNWLYGDSWKPHVRNEPRCPYIIKPIPFELRDC